jgi:response regulator RpfG family c-di-GMP phosphodiesterase
MQMPNLNGIETLRAIQDISPNTVRLMLTGNADQQTATDAINKGNIVNAGVKTHHWPE